MMNADWMQARIAELERVNATLVAERDEAIALRDKVIADLRVSWDDANTFLKARDAAVRERDAEVKRRQNFASAVILTEHDLDEARYWRDLWKRAAHRLWRESGREFRMLVASLYGSPATRRVEGIDLFGRDDIDDDLPLMGAAWGASAPHHDPDHP